MLLLDGAADDRPVGWSRPPNGQCVVGANFPTAVNSCLECGMKDAMKWMESAPLSANFDLIAAFVIEILADSLSNLLI